MRILLPFLIFVTTFVQAQTDCVLKLEKDSIKIYSCKVTTSKFKASKSTFQVNGTLSQLTAMILDVDHYPDWQYKAKSANILKRVSDTEIIYYTEVSSPSPASNRDFIIHLTITQDQKTKAVHVDVVSIPDYLPEKKGIVRVPYSKATWDIKPLANGKLSVEYYIEIDLGGLVPAWLVNMVAHEAPYLTFKALREKVGSYKNKEVSFIKN